jgi:hypothetical protein
MQDMSPQLDRAGPATSGIALGTPAAGFVSVSECSRGLDKGESGTKTSIETETGPPIRCDRHDGGQIRRILPRVLNDFLTTPLARWDGLHLVFDLWLLESHLRRRVERSNRVDDLRLTGRGDSVGLSAAVTWKGIRSRVAVRVEEIRLRRRYLGFRLRKARVLGGVPVPLGAVEILIRELADDVATVFRGEGIVVLDFTRWIPRELELSVLTVQATDSALHLWLGPGVLLDMPRRPRPALTAGGDEPGTA